MRSTPARSARRSQLVGHIAGKAGRRAQRDQHEIGVLAKVRRSTMPGYARPNTSAKRASTSSTTAADGQHVAVVPVLVVAIEVRPRRVADVHGVLEIELVGRAGRAAGTRRPASAVGTSTDS